MTHPSRIHTLLPALLWLVTLLPLSAQFNFVPNPSFEEISSCDIEYGDADLAPPWRIVNDPIATPDLFHYCSTNPFFVPPAAQCFPVTPYSGEGMVGLVNLTVEERIYARLLGELPTNIDIYVSYAILPRKKCEPDSFSILCYSNTQCLVFADIQLQNRELVLELDTILSYADGWTVQETCYQATGEEKMILLGDYKGAVATDQYCTAIEPGFNFSYFYVDDVIVSPFDVVPDTLILCEGEAVTVDASFYEVPIRWSDGWSGGMRTISEGGRYTVYGDLADCYMTDQTVVVVISEETEAIEVDLCESGRVLLRSPVPAVWPNGDTSATFLARSPGIYTAQLLSECGERSVQYFVEAGDCSIRHFVPNAFSPNHDGINDQLEFFFASDHAFTGELSVYDRWGNQLFTAEQCGWPKYPKMGRHL